MTEPIEESYFKWLCAKVTTSNHPTPSSSYWSLLALLHHTEFIFLVPGDDNRAKDGLDLRSDFESSTGMADPHWDAFGCSVLEMLIAFAHKADFQTDLNASEWFWLMIMNTGLDEFHDSSELDFDEAVEILESIVWRTYDSRGMLFPLDRPNHDQKETEIWYQFCEYLVEKDII